MSKKVNDICPPCVDKLSMKRYVLNHIKEGSHIYREGHITAKGIIGASKSHPKPKVFLQEKLAEYHNRIITECKIVGICWSSIGCDIDRIEDFYRIATEFLRYATRMGVFNEIDKEWQLFAKYLIVICYLTAKLEQRDIVTTKPKTTDEMLAYWMKCDDNKQEQLINELHLLLKGQKGRRVAFVIFALERNGYILSMDRDTKAIYNLFKEAFGIEGTEEAIRQQLEKPIDSKREEAIKSIEERLP